MTMEEVAKDHFVVHMQDGDIRPPSEALLRFAKASRTFSFLTPSTASGFTDQVRKQYVREKSKA